MSLYVAPVLVPAARAKNGDDRLDLLVSDLNPPACMRFCFSWCGNWSRWRIPSQLKLIILWRESRFSHLYFQSVHVCQLCSILFLDVHFDVGKMTWHFGPCYGFSLADAEKSTLTHFLHILANFQTSFHLCCRHLFTHQTFSWLSFTLQAQTLVWTHEGVYASLVSTWWWVKTLQYDVRYFVIY